MISCLKMIYTTNHVLRSKRHHFLFLFMLLLFESASHCLAGDTLKVMLTGDLLLDRGVRTEIERTNIDSLFVPWVDSLFTNSDVVVANLECPATKIKAPVHKKYIFRGEPEWLPALRQHGITHLNLANNHSIDQGRRGLIDTRDNILASGMTPIGAGATMDEAAEPVLLASTPRNVWLIASLRLALENYAYLTNRPCVSQESMETLIDRIQQLRATDPQCYIIVSLHWGGENTMRPILPQIVDAHKMIDAGADILVCHHSHTLQDIELYHGHRIYYSIGNFIFDLSKPHQCEACMVSIKITGTASEVETIPVHIIDCRPQQPVP